MSAVDVSRGILLLLDETRLIRRVMLRKRADGSVCDVQAWESQPVTAEGKSLAYEQAYQLADNRLVSLLPFPIASKGVQAVSQSPSGETQVLFRAGESKADGKPTVHVEVWRRNALVEKIDLSSVHGPILTSSCVCWSSDESRLYYVAEPKTADAVHVWDTTSSADSAPTKPGAQDPELRRGRGYEFRKSLCVRGSQAALRSR